LSRGAGHPLELQGNGALPSSLEFVEGWGMAVGAQSRVLRPGSVDEIAKCFDIARRERVSLALRGTGNSYGDASVNERGHVLDVSRMNRVLDFDVESGRATLEPGMTIEKLWKTILPHGFWPRVVSGTMFPSVAGALRFQITPGGTQVMDIDSALYPRKPIERLGVAPLTSMFFYGENERRGANDWRPEIHDSDGISMWTGAGEWIWRPLTNPAQLHFSSYVDENPRGFGLLQRDRNWDHYQDDGVYYDRRPSVWVEPKPGLSGGWGKGSVQLVEIPTVDETFDNIVAFWNPFDRPKPGQELLFGYRLHWGTRMPYASPLGQTVATRTGIGGTVGQKRQYYSWHFAVDFSGGELGALPKDAPVEAVISTSHGQTEHVTAHYIDEIRGYRALFDVKPPEDSVDPIDMRLYLRINGRPLTETWIYLWTPPSLKDRKAALA